MNKKIWKELLAFVDSKIVEAKYFGGSMKAYYDLCAVKSKMLELAEGHRDDRNTQGHSPGSRRRTYPCYS